MRLRQNCMGNPRAWICSMAVLTWGFVGCGNEPGDKELFELEAGLSGALEYCDDAGQCQSLANPNECVTLTIEVDLATGQSCERCVGAGGETIYDDCVHSTVVCDVVTAPEPDCVVCAHYQGPIVYSTCVPDEEKKCSVYSDAGSGALCEVCLDDAGKVVSRDCRNRCEGIACPAVVPTCPEGTRPEPSPTDCCGFECVPTTSCDSVLCAACEPGEERVYDDADDCCGRCEAPPVCDEVCTQDFLICPQGSQAVPDPSSCCGFTCEPTNCDHVFCFAPPPVCGEDERLSFENNCCGECVKEPDHCDLVDCAVPIDACPDGTAPKPDPLSCCGVICEPVDCPPVAAPFCPDGSELVTDPADPCGVVCIPARCTALDIACPAVVSVCEPGERLSYEENCCGSCVPDRCSDKACPAFGPCAEGLVSKFVPDPEGCCELQECVVPCLSDDACPDGETCRGEDVCLSCSDQPDAVCPSVCYGACAPALTL